MNAEELPDYWSTIANDRGYSEDRRRYAVFRLFQRHVKVGISLHELGKMLDHPVWLKPDNILVVQSLGGQVPVEFNLQDTIFRLAVFPNLTDDRLGYWAIYCRFEGKISAGEAYDILMEKETELNGEGDYWSSVLSRITHLKMNEGIINFFE